MKNTTRRALRRSSSLTSQVRYRGVVPLCLVPLCLFFCCDVPAFSSVLRGKCCNAAHHSLHRCRAVPCRHVAWCSSFITHFTDAVPWRGAVLWRLFCRCDVQAFYIRNMMVLARSSITLRFFRKAHETDQSLSFVHKTSDFSLFKDLCTTDFTSAVPWRGAVPLCLLFH